MRLFQYFAAIACFATVGAVAVSAHGLGKVAPTQDAPIPLADQFLGSAINDGQLTSYGLDISGNRTSLAGASAAPSTQDRAQVVMTVSGPVQGRKTPMNKEFLGIPYAAPPIGRLRWMPPQPHVSWTSPWDATKAGPSCESSEDCLTLSVWTPLDAEPNSRLPVMFWIHGGGYVTGTGTPDAATLSRVGHVIVVSLEYRLGAAGWLALPWSGTKGSDVVGNYGLLDQQAGLRWTNDNIRAFGGDPANVTIFGHSAGGYSVCTHLVAPMSKNLFQKAIVQSGYCDWTYPSRAETEGYGLKFAHLVGCDDDQVALLSCMRSVPFAKLARASTSSAVTTGNIAATSFYWGPVTGGRVVPFPPLEGIVRGTTPAIPMMLGTTHNDGSRFASRFVEHGMSPAQYKAFLVRRFGAKASAVARAYSLAQYPNAGQALAAIFSDVPGNYGYVSNCSQMKIDRKLAERMPVYAFELRDTVTPETINGVHIGSTHGAELAYIFPSDSHPLTGRQATLSTQMIKMWAQFASTGDPNGSGNPLWPRFKSPSDVLGLSTSGVAPVKAYLEEHKCGFWQKLNLPPTTRQTF